jgi:alpha-galactosidase
MAFGLWIEPEMVNPDSDLYREHPDWVYHFPERPRSESRNQLILNLCMDEVRSFVSDQLDRLLSTHDVEFVRLDMNRPFSQPGWPDAPRERQREVWVRHTRALYDVLDRVRERHPDVLIETCAGGGGRVDLGMFRRTHQSWPSDNVDPVDRLHIQEGYSHAYAPKTMKQWVTDGWAETGRETSLDYRFHVAMTGSLGLSAALTEWSDAELETARELVAEYKRLRPLVENGNQYRLRSPRDGETSAVAYVDDARSRAAVFVFRQTPHYGDPRPSIPVRGLRDDARYRIEGEETGTALSGRALRTRGLDVDLRGDFRSEVVVLERVDDGEVPGRDTS